MRTDDPIYLDNNATTPLLPEVLDAMLPYLREHFGNPSSSHIFGQRTHRAIEVAREQVATLIGAEPQEIIFTSGGTEANNLAIRGVIEASGGSGKIVTSTVEHPATSQPCTWLEARGAQVTRLGVDENGRVREDAAARAIDAQTTLVTVMHSNNETGTLQPIGALSEMAHAAGALIHTDAAQSLGKIPVNVQKLGVDLLSCAGHKLYAPKGVGALYIRRGTLISPFTLGAGHERGLRPGTENVASIVGLGQAALAAKRDLTEVAQRMKHLRDLLWTRLATAIPNLRLNGHPELRLPNTLNIRFPSVTGDAVLAGAPEIAASTGSACDAGQTTASAVILAMGIPADEATGSLRLSLGRDTDEAQTLRAANALIEAWTQASKVG